MGARELLGPFVFLVIGCQVGVGAHAQEVGFRAGPSVSIASGADVIGDFGIRFHAAVFWRKPIDRMVSIQPEVLYGENAYEARQDGPVEFQYLQTNLLAKFPVAPSDGTVTELFAGLGLAIIVGCRADGTNCGFSIAGSADRLPIHPVQPRISFGIGGSIHAGRRVAAGNIHFVWDFRAQIGPRPLTNRLEGVQPVSLGSIQGSLGIAFGT